MSTRSSSQLRTFSSSRSPIHFVPVNHPIAARAVHLPEPLHRDPADRIILATALILGFPLATRDRRLRRYPHVPMLW